MEKIRLRRRKKDRACQGDFRIGPVERQVLGQLIREEMVEEAMQIVGQKLETAMQEDLEMEQRIAVFGIRRKVLDKQRQVIWDLAMVAGVTAGEVTGVLRRWGLAIR